MSACPYLDRAVYYRVENVPDAFSEGSRFANILEQLHKTGELSKTSLNMLVKEGFIALSRLASKEISYTEYMVLAEQERRNRKSYQSSRQMKTLSPPYVAVLENFKRACEYVVTHPCHQTKEDKMRTNYVLIDFENVQPESLAALQQDHFKVMLFVGANQANIPFAVVDAMQALCGRAEYVKIAGNGKNALDFHIAYYIGLLAAKDPTAYFHIISRDTGFDPLIAHLKSKNISAAREADIGEIPLVKATPLAPPLPVVQLPLPPSRLIVRPPAPPPPSTKIHDQRMTTVWEKLRPPKATKPRTVKTLSSHIKAMFPNAITDAETANIIADMKRRKDIMIADNKITYNF